MIKAGALLAVALVLAGPAARAQTYPSRQITLIIPFTPGGSNDLVGRAVGKKLSEAWGRAGGGRKPRWRRHPDRQHRRRQSAARWLHAAPGVADVHHQPGDPEDHAVRHGEGFHADCLPGPRAAAGHDIEQAACAVRRRAVYPGQEQTWPDHLRFGRPWQHQPDFDRSDRAGGRREARACSPTRAAHRRSTISPAAMSTSMYPVFRRRSSSSEAARSRASCGDERPANGAVARRAHACGGAGHRAPMRKRGGASSARPGCLRMSFMR